MQWDEVSEMLKRSYNTSESHQRLKICFKYYSESQKAIPNYVKLDRAKIVYLYGNLERKVRAVEERELWCEM